MTLRTTLTAVALATGCVASASAASLDGRNVHGSFSIDGLALPGVIDETRTVGDGVEFRYDGNAGYYEFADFKDTTVTIGLFTSDFGEHSELTSWRFTLDEGRSFSSIALLSDDHPRPLNYFITDGELFFSTLPFGPDRGQPSQPNTLFTATFQLAINDTTAPVPEPETYALMLAGLGLVGMAARRRRQQEGGAR